MGVKKQILIGVSRFSMNFNIQAATLFDKYCTVLSVFSCKLYVAVYWLVGFRADMDFDLDPGVVHICEYMNELKDMMYSGKYWAENIPDLDLQLQYLWNVMES